MSFYRDGLRFECTRCSRCCRHEPGFVFLSEGDIERLTAGLSLEREEFIERYCVRVPSAQGFRLSLAERPDFDCVFWGSGGCAVYELRPVQCRSYPFWHSHLLSQAAWMSLRPHCPGVEQGTLHTSAEIESWLRLRDDQPLILMPDEKEDDA